MQTLLENQKNIQNTPDSRTLDIHHNELKSTNPLVLPKKSSSNIRPYNYLCFCFLLFTFFFSDFQYGFRSSRSTVDLLTVVSDRIARAFNRSGATRAVALDISKAFDRVWHAGLLHKLKSYGISGQIFDLISSFLSNRPLQVALDGKSSQEYPVNAGVPQGSICAPTLYINDLPDDVICNIAIYADDTTL